MRRTTTPPEISSTECTGCGICVKACPVFTLEMKDGKAVVDRGDWCIECGHCGAVCPVDAVVQKKTVSELSMDIDFLGGERFACPH